LAAARAVIFTQLVNDPAGLWECQNPGARASSQQRGAFTKQRQELFKIIEDLVLWENTTNEEVLERARAEIRRSWREVCELNKDHPQAAVLFNPDKLPGLHDPFAGGGAIPLEAQRLGLESYASDLNPVAVLINKAMIEIPPKFAGREPVNPDWQNSTVAQKLGRVWPGASGLAEDVRFYGAWMREQAQKRIGHLYPPVEITAEMAKERPDLKPLVGQKFTVIAWLWARTVKSPNPAFSHVDVPLVSSFVISSKDGKEAFVFPEVNTDCYRFMVKMGPPTQEAFCGTKSKGKGANFRCLISDSPISAEYIRAEGMAQRIGQRLMAIVVDGPRGRLYLNPTAAQEAKAHEAKPSWKPDVEFFQQALGFRVGNYGLSRWSDLFTDRQLVGLSTFSDLIGEARENILREPSTVRSPDDGVTLVSNGSGATAYAEAVSVYLAFAVDKVADRNSTGCAWASLREHARNTFGRQAVPMVWDFAESNPLSDSSGNFAGGIESIFHALHSISTVARGAAIQANAQSQTVSSDKFVSTDPPYYDNIGYADLSDFFYVWLRHSLRKIFPDLLSTITVPKAEELVATPARHGGKSKAETFFLGGMTDAMRRLAAQSHVSAPITIYYAFKQSETEAIAGTASTGWETFLESVNQAGLQVSGTWPMSTELGRRMRGTDSNALASSIVLVCRKRPADAPSISRREFIRELNGVLPEALDEMTKGSGNERSPVAPVDLSQAIIGPGMAVFSKYAAVLEADGSPMSVRTALQLINRFLAEDDFDADTQFCLSWFEQNGWKDGPYGDAETLATGKGTSVGGVKDAGVIQSGGGKVRLLKWSEYPAGWDPIKDNRTPIWEALHHLIRALKRDGGETVSGALLASLGGKAEAVRQLAYRLYTLCERLGQAEDARAYNELITSWTGIETAAAASKQASPRLPGFENT
jgi:putative DNA methylase